MKRSSPTSGDRIEALYRLHAPASGASALARAIAYEQTVELPPESIRDPLVESRVVGRVEAVEAVTGTNDLFDVGLSFDSELACGQLSQLWNLVWGNVSLWPGVRLHRLVLPVSLRRRLAGPAHGVRGLRRATGVGGRPLLATALKPRGAGIEALARIAAAFAAGGGDLVKDDQNLNDARFEDFDARVSRCAEAVAESNARHGTRCLYLPHLAGPPAELERRSRRLHELGVQGILAAPFLLGLDTTAEIVRRHGWILMAHPAATGSHFVHPRSGVEPGVLLGTVFRLAGADVSIFPHAGGRFHFSEDDCRSVAQALRAPADPHPPSMPAPAGGMHFDRLDEMWAFYGPDSIFLVGGALLDAGAALQSETRRFVERLRDRFGEQAWEAGEEISACEMPAASPAGTLLTHLRFRPGFEWEGRPSTVYKTDPALPFRGVRRVELIGGQGERTAFDLRYFEVEPGGFTSLEKHRHTHVILGARGRGRLTGPDRDDTIEVHDVAYVAPMEVHQLRNAGEEPFGFFCLVDHDRDRPQPA